MSILKRRYQRHGRFSRLRRSNNFIEFLARMVTNLGATGTSDDFVAIADVFSSGVLTLTGNAANNETVVVGGKTYTFQTVLTEEDGNVFIGVDASASIDNLIAAITLGAGSGTLYAQETSRHPTATASAGAGDTMDVDAKSPGVAGDLIDTTETLTSGSFGAATLTGGVDGKLTLVAHGLSNAEGPIHLSTSGTLPAGLLVAPVDYWANVLDNDNITLSLTRGGSKVIVTDTGAGTHSLIKGTQTHDIHALLDSNKSETIAAASDVDDLS